MLCPICNFEVSNKKGLASHFRHQSSTHPNYNTWLENERWKDKIENKDYVICLECGLRLETLARHLKSEHNLTAEDYRKKYGDKVLIRAENLTSKRKISIKNRSGGFGKGSTKIIRCPECGVLHNVSKFFSENRHNPKCDKCKKEEINLKWKNLKEPQDYVTCLECGYRSENLTSHINNEHPNYREKHPKALIVSLSSSVRDKTHLIGKKHTDTTKKKMSENAGKWNLGLTKETDIRVLDISKKLSGKTAWNKGETCETNESVKRAFEKLRKYYSENKRTWDNGLKVNLTLEDFKPFMDDLGRVDHAAISKEIGISNVTINKYMRELSLEKTKKYIEERSESNIIKIDKEVLLKYALKNKKIAVGKVIAELGYSFRVIKRECKKHGLKTYSRNIKQSCLLNIISKSLGIEEYYTEWQDSRFKNPKTGYRFKFDGYFSSINLVVEFHGHQHYMYPNVYHKTEEEYLDQLTRDKDKENLIRANPDFKFFKVLEDEPFDNIDYIRGRLVSEGILKIF